MAAAGTVYVEMVVVIANESTDNKLRRAIEELEELAKDYPFLPLETPVNELKEAYEELSHVSAR